MGKAVAMKQLKTLLRNWILALLLPRPVIGLRYLPRYFWHWIIYARLAKYEKIRFMDLYPCLGDWSTHTPFDAHYFYQGAWLARRIRASRTDKHVDIGSSALTISVLSAYVETTFVDFRPLQASLSGLNSIAGNILDLPFEDNSVNSLSCLHVIEHIGLGRYGDPLDPQGSVKAAWELERVVNSGGKLFISLPIGRERICFNAHRVHAPDTVLKMFSQMKLIQFSYVDDGGNYHEDKSIEFANNMEFGCGMFHFEKH